MQKYRPYIAFLVAAIVMLLVFPVRGKFIYKYQKGRPWMYETLVAPMDFPILKTNAEILSEKEAKASEMVPCYGLESNVAGAKLDALGSMVADGTLDAAVADTLSDLLAACYEAGVVAEFESDATDGVLFIKKDKRLEQTPASDVYTVNSALTRIRSELSFRFPGAVLDSLVDEARLASLVAPNLVFDSGTTELLHRESIDFVSPTKGMIYEGQLIVSKGETVTADVAQLLDSYKAEYQRSMGYTGSLWQIIASHAIIIAALLALLFFTILYVEREILGDFKRLLFVLMIDLTAFLACALITQYRESLLMIFPFSVLILYMNAFFDKPISATVYIISLLPLLVIPEDGVQLFFMNAIAGGLLLLTSQKYRRGWRQFVNVAFVFFSLLFVYTAFNYMSDGDYMVMRRLDIAKMAFNAVLTVFLYPFVHLLERIFSFVSYDRLWNMTDTNDNLLLRELSLKAPGTFQHSLQVANLAEEAARRIGADAMLTRVGALYHDIGKMENPSCFVENQTAGDNSYHHGLSPEDSARYIISHVDDGVALARKQRLPEIVVDFIRSHHGRSRTGYFYVQYCNNGGDPANVAPFTYNGILPKTKEQAVLMIADSVEAASRSLKEYNDQSLSELVDRIVNGKNAEGQFNESEISIAEIGAVKESLKASLMQIYHGRISYPKAKTEAKEG